MSLVAKRGINAMSERWRRWCELSVQNSPSKRGDTLIEVMFAIAVFSMVAVISISMMNSGVASGERSLELVTARNELNGQAEALRYIHSSYVSELTLPSCDELSDAELQKGGKCQQFAKLWREITSDDNVMAPRGYEGSASFSLPEGTTGSCADYYDDADGASTSVLAQNHAFVLNGRKIGEDQLIELGDDTKTQSIEMAKNVYISSKDSGSAGVFRAPTLGARLIYTQDEASDESQSSAEQLSSSQKYNYLKYAEGIWIVAVGGWYDEIGAIGRSGYDFYDFYIQSCWFGSNSKSPSTIDSVIRLYNPEAER